MISYLYFSDIERDAVTIFTKYISPDAVRPIPITEQIRNDIVGKLLLMPTDISCNFKIRRYIPGALLSFRKHESHPSLKVSSLVFHLCSEDMWRGWYGGPKLLCLCTVGSLHHLGATVSLCFLIFEWSKLSHCRVSLLLCFESTIRV